MNVLSKPRKSIGKVIDNLRHPGQRIVSSTGYLDFVEVEKGVRKSASVLSSVQGKYSIYNALARQRWSESEKGSGPSDQSARVLAQLHDKRFALLVDPASQQTAKSVLAPVFDRIRKEWEAPSAKVTRVNYAGYSWNAGPLTRNIVYADHFSEVALGAIREYVEVLGLRDVAEHYFSSYVGICNVRGYRLTGKPKKKNTHTNEEFHSIEEVPAHFDGIPYERGRALKVMVFRDGADDSVPLTRGHGALEFSTGEDDWESVSGAPYSAAILEANFLWHRAPKPDDDKLRDAIEITFIPRISPDFPVLASGSQAGAPLNPFDPWDMPL